MCVVLKKLCVRNREREGAIRSNTTQNIIIIYLIPIIFQFDEFEYFNVSFRCLIVQCHLNNDLRSVMCSSEIAEIAAKNSLIIRRNAQSHFQSHHKLDRVSFLLASIFLRRILNIFGIQKYRLCVLTATLRSVFRV